MTVGIVGASGNIAGYIVKRFEKERISTLRIGRNRNADIQLELRETDRFDYLVLESIDVLIFMAGITSPDKCAMEPEGSWKVNVTGTEHFIKEALSRGCRVLFFSSDAVFGNASSTSFDEDAETRALTPYGKMKKKIEDSFKQVPLFKAIRLSYVASPTDRFTSYCMECIRKREEAEVFHPFYRNMTTVSDVIESVLFLIDNWENYKPTFLNVAGTELVSRIRMADEINWCFEDRLRYKIVSPPRGFFENRPVVARMRSMYLEKYGIIKKGDFSEKYKRELERITL